MIDFSTVANETSAAAIGSELLAPEWAEGCRMPQEPFQVWKLSGQAAVLRTNAKIEISSSTSSS